LNQKLYNNCIILFTITQGAKTKVVRIRLRRMGAKKKAFYRIIVANKQSPRDGRFIETIGTYDPNTKPETVTLRNERAAYWLGVGAQPSDGVIRLLQRANLVDAAGSPIKQAQAPESVVAPAA
jgi:small subunit ribosomal protein S16